MVVCGAFSAAKQLAEIAKRAARFSGMLRRNLDRSNIRGGLVETGERRCVNEGKRAEKACSWCGTHAVAVHAELGAVQRGLLTVEMGTIWAQSGHDKDFVGFFPAL